jgi:methylmalonyl-CoA mutase C-terminal domain/subunit
MKKVLITKIGLDGHDVGAKIIVKLLKENNFEVGYLGIRQEIEDIVAKAKEFKPDVIGVSIMTGGHNFFMPKLKKALDKENLKKVKLVCGGLIPEKDKKKLLKTVDAVFSNNSSLNDILHYFKKCI